MNKKSVSKSGLFLIELILSIFFFIIAAALILQLFVKSHFISENTISINNALLYSQNMSEVFLSDNGSFESVQNLYSDNYINVSDCRDNILLLLFNKDWQFVNSYTEAAYSVVAAYSNDDSFSYLDVYINEYSDQLEYFLTSGDYGSSLLCTGYIYHQEVKKYNGH